jgi:transposase
VAPGPRVAVSIEGTRSYGIGLARALAAAGLLVLECEQPRRRAQRRGKGKSDPIDAHLAVLAALRLTIFNSGGYGVWSPGARCAMPEA